MKYRGFRDSGRRRTAGLLVAACAAGLLGATGGPARADSIVDVIRNPVPPFSGINTVFPNWIRVPTLSLVIAECDDATCAWCADGRINGITIYNYGTATGGPSADITGMYFALVCNGTNSGILTMTYANNWVVGGPTYPAWTWAGSIPWANDPCGINGCSCLVNLFVYTDIGACPTEGATIDLGPGYNSLDNRGGITDTCGSAAPLGSITDGNLKHISYVSKVADREAAAPGDTVNYTVYLGRPGTSYTSLVVMDSMPAYTHLIAGSAVPALDPGYDPDPGPPARLRWTLPGATSAGGRTQEIQFALTVDWGNGEGFEPGAGDEAAPEGFRLTNRAQAFYNGLAGCGTASPVSGPAGPIVRRWMMWMLGDNDLLYASSLGQPPDEIIYEMFIRNASNTKTWWDVTFSDTLPAGIDCWPPGFGFEDPLVGWTMTPTAAAAANPGRLLTGSGTLLTWRFDLPPSKTLSLRWKACVRTSAEVDDNVVNLVSVLALGKTGIVGGTGSSRVPKTYTNVTKVILRTTYVSYVGNAGNADLSGYEGHKIVFFPLHKSTAFELRGLEYSGAGTWAATGGSSASIGCMIGDCFSGFAGNAGPCPFAALSGGGIPGCKTERTPAVYDPVGWHGVVPTLPYNFIYKLTSNSPLGWQMLTNITADRDDRITPAPSSSLTFAGWIHYLWRQATPSADLWKGDALTLINTGRLPDDTVDPSATTGVHLFKFDYVTLTWQYMRSYDLGGESAAFDQGTPPAAEGPWRVVSSDTALIVYQGFNLIYDSKTEGNNYGCIWTRENGHLVSDVGSGTFYGIVLDEDFNYQVVIGNTGAAAADYRIWLYVPDNTAAVGNMPPNINGTVGKWVPKGLGTVVAGLAAPGNPRLYQRDGNPFDGHGGIGLFKVELNQGGPIQVGAGSAQGLWSCVAGGSALHAADGQAVGTEYWMHHALGNKCGADNMTTTVVNVFVPSRDTNVRAVSEDGYDATYTTTGPDQCVAFKTLTTPSVKRNYRFNITGVGGSGGIVHYAQQMVTQKGYTAPFLHSGVHYVIVAPSVAFVGQSFWITVVVRAALGGTQTDYAGTTSFTSTDPNANMAGVAMDTYDYIWAPATDNGVHIFFNVIFTALGLQSIVAMDVADGSITGLATIIVVAVDVKLTKEPRLAIAASGDTVRFRICWSNYSSGSAFTFVITDAVPKGTTYVPEVPSAMNCGSTDGVAMTVAYSDSTTTPPPSWTSVPSGMVGTAGTRWLRWTVPVTGIQTTGCACFRITVN